jgi:single-strand DNA-binding protein
MAMPDEDSDKGVLLFGSLAFVHAQGLHPLSFLNDLSRPSTSSNPRSLGPSCRLRGCPHHPSDRGSPPRLRAPVERASWPSLTVFSRGDEPPAKQKRNLEMQNLVILAGNVGATPETRSTQGGTKITQFSLATSRPKRDSEGKIMKDSDNRRIEDTEWHRITCFNGVGKTVAQYVDKGQKVMVRGRIHYTRWTDHENIERYGVEIIADEVTFLSRGRQQQANTQDQSDLDDDVPF